MAESTFSGSHPFRPSCLLAAYEYECSQFGDDADALRTAAAEFVEGRLRVINDGLCPRCERAFVSGEIPSGSRSTACRCVPVCSDCSTAEFELGGTSPASLSDGDCLNFVALVSVIAWPVDLAAQGEFLAEWRSRYNIHRGVVVLGVDENPKVLHEGREARLIQRPHPGGWAEFGYDEKQDDEERRGR